VLNKVLYHGKAYEAAEIQQHAFVTSMLDGPGWSTSQPNQLPPGKEHLLPTEQETAWDLEPVSMI